MYGTQRRPYRQGDGHSPKCTRITRRRETRLVNQAKTSNNSNWLHAVGFVVLAAIVISWALGY